MRASRLSCLRCTRAGLLQSSSPPRAVVRNDPLTRWAEKLSDGWPRRRLNSRLCVGLEGGGGAFNAMNSVRSCLYFGTACPPCFLSLHGAGDIRSLHARGGAHAATDFTEGGVALNKVAKFGEDFFLNDSSCRQLPLVALENYTNRSESILSLRLPPCARLLAGHENSGVSRKYIDGVDGGAGDCRAECVVYIPQYGTISSLNVVTSMGIALFYATLDAHYPSARTLLSEGATPFNIIGTEGSHALEELHAYQRFFRQQLPRAISNDGSTRVDQRPIHPLFYKKNMSSIIEVHHHLRQLMLRVCQGGQFTSSPERFGLSVVYENEQDQRSLSGIVRSANAFLVDKVFYFGRKKMNVVGTIGTQHYTPPVYIGSSIANNNNNNNNNKAESWAAALLKRIEVENGGPVSLWFLDCGHEFLYSEPTYFSSDHARGCSEACAWFTAHRGDPQFTVNLCDDEERIRVALECSNGGVVLLVPQEGRLPPFQLLRRCERIVALLPNSARTGGDAGLPISVAAGIALQRLSAVMHPQVSIF